jgi:L-cysteine S-thiosulfotransferase
MKRFALALAALAFTAAADERLDQTVKQYREALKDASPGELYVAMGDELFRAQRGPKNESLESCDFGVGPGVLRGAYAQLPRFFADSGKVEDLESRLMTCMARIQGFGEEAFPRLALADPRMADMRRLAAFIAAQSNGMPLAAPLDHPKEVEAYRIGERLFHRRAGAHDFSCATCHTVQGKRIRLQRLADFTDRSVAQAALSTWPAYRAAPGELHTLQDWLSTCYWAARHPQMRYGSEVSIALQVFLAQQAKGGIVATPGIKR